MKTGVLLTNLMGDVTGLNGDAATAKAAELGFSGVQWRCIDEFSAENLRHKGAALLKRVADCGLELTGLGAEIEWKPGLALEDRFGDAFGVIDFAADSGAPLVIVHGGHMGRPVGRPPVHSPEWTEFIRVMRRLCEHAESKGVDVAIEGGGAYHVISGWERVLRACREIASPRIAVNLDPANMVMAASDPVLGVFNLGKLIRHAHIKDAVLLDAPQSNGAFYHEVFAGEGHVRFPELLHALVCVGYDGWLVVEREASAMPLPQKEIELRRTREMIEGIVAAISADRPASGQANAGG